MARSAESNRGRGHKSRRPNGMCTRGLCMRSTGNVGAPRARPLTHIVVLSSCMGQSSGALTKPRRVLRALLPWDHRARWRQPALRRAFISEGMLGVSNRGRSHTVRAPRHRAGLPSVNIPTYGKEGRATHTITRPTCALKAWRGETQRSRMRIFSTQTHISTQLGDVCRCLCVHDSAYMTLRLCLCISVSASRSLT